MVWYFGLFCLVSVYLSTSWSFGIRVDSTLLVIIVLLLACVRVSMYFIYLLVITFQFVMTRNDYVVGVEKR